MAFNRVLRTVALGLLWVGLLTCRVAWSDDLAGVDRHIVKEPAYKTKDVKYALAVFGAKAKTRVWLALDGDTLYADTNGNGDLTEPGERFAPQKEFSNPEEGTYSFIVSEIRDGERIHKNLSVSVSKFQGVQNEPIVKKLLTKEPNARAFQISAEMDLASWHGSGIGGQVIQRAFLFDAHGILQFATQPAQAPILHFGGPWQISLFGPHTLVVGRSKDLVLGVGTPGVGPGTTVWVDYQDVIPENVFPVASISFPPKNAGDRPVEELYELKHRC